MHETPFVFITYCSIIVYILGIIMSIISTQQCPSRYYQHKILQERQKMHRLTLYFIFTTSWKPFPSSHSLEAVLCCTISQCCHQQSHRSPVCHFSSNHTDCLLLCGIFSCQEIGPNNSGFCACLWQAFCTVSSYQGNGLYSAAYQTNTETIFHFLTLRLFTVAKKEKISCMKMTFWHLLILPAGVKIPEFCTCTKIILTL